MMIATVFVGLVLAIGIRVEAGPTPNLERCSQSDNEMISDCVESGYDYEQFGWEKPCKMLEITEECLRSINGNCTIDFFEDLSQLQQMCDQKKSGGCSEYHNWAIGECVERAERTEDGVRKKGIKACDMVKILEECVESINGNCATDVGPSKEMFQHECDQEKRTP